MLGESQDDSERESIQQSTTSTTSSWLSHPIGKYWSVKLDDFLSSTGKHVKKSLNPLPRPSIPATSFSDSEVDGAFI